MGSTQHRDRWNKGKLVGQKPPLKPKDIWAIRILLQNAHHIRDLALFNLAIDSKLRCCDLVKLRVRDITHSNQSLPRAMVVQRKTQRPVQFELTEPTRLAVAAWLERAHLRPTVPLPEPYREFPACLDPAVRQNRASLGGRDRLGFNDLRYPYHAADQGDADLQTHQEPAGGATLAWPSQT